MSSLWSCCIFKTQDYSKGFKKRFLSLSGNNLNYYDSTTDSKPKGVIDLMSVQTIVWLDDYKFGDGLIRFLILTKTRNHFCCCDAQNRVQMETLFAKYSPTDILIYKSIIHKKSPLFRWNSQLFFITSSGHLIRTIDESLDGISEVLHLSNPSLFKSEIQDNKSTDQSDIHKYTYIITYGDITWTISLGVINLEVYKNLDKFIHFILVGYPIPSLPYDKIFDLINKGYYTKSYTIREAVRKGLPDNIRRNAWLVFLGQKFSPIGDLDSPPNSNYETNIPDYIDVKKRNDILNILDVFMKKNPLYVIHTGLVVLINRLLTYLNKQETYHVLNYIINHTAPIWLLPMNNNDENQILTRMECSTMEGLIAYLLDKRYLYFLEKKFNINIFLNLWLSTFLTELPEKVFHCFIDCLLYEGYPILIKLLSSIISCNYLQIEKCQTKEELEMIFSTLLQNTYNYEDLHMSLLENGIEITKDIIETNRKNQWGSFALYLSEVCQLEDKKQSIIDTIRNTSTTIVSNIGNIKTKILNKDNPQLSIYSNNNINYNYNRDNIDLNFTTNTTNNNDIYIIINKLEDGLLECINNAKNLIHSMTQKTKVLKILADEATQRIKGNANALNFQLPPNKLSQPIDLYLSLLSMIWLFIYSIIHIYEYNFELKLKEASWKSFNTVSKNVYTELILLLFKNVVNLNDSLTYLVKVYTESKIDLSSYNLLYEEKDQFTDWFQNITSVPTHHGLNETKMFIERISKQIVL